MIKKLFSKIPLLGGIVYCTKDDFLEGLYRATFNIGISTFPITLGALIVKSLSEYPIGYMETLIKISYNGELFLYSMAILAPLVYPAYKKEFKRDVLFLVLVIIGLFISTIFFTLYRANVLIRDPEFVFSISCIVFISSAVISYLAAVYSNRKGRGAGEIDKKRTNDFTNALLKRHQ